MCNGDVECIFNCKIGVETIAATMLKLSWMKEMMKVFNSVETATGGQLARFNLACLARAQHARKMQLRKCFTRREKILWIKGSHVAAADWSGGFL
ncbi:hypothetical protein L195_g057845 [Trifolium pratense]|uniref:Uncharacterized protein n=1 Tax=Trifolium pratense TaxID=57577 RepID=A0A2K3KX81_TRIPR|nr:hypothetical protein L195_g057845 [Trifolium pratense]